MPEVANCETTTFRGIITYKYEAEWLLDTVEAKFEPREEVVLAIVLLARLEDQADIPVGTVLSNEIGLFGGDSAKVSIQRFDQFHEEI